MDSRFLTRFKYESLRKFTNDFSDENLIGTFDFGKIYKVIILWNELIPRPLVVKIWDSSNFDVYDNEQRLMREITFLRNENINCLPSLVKLCGYVMDKEHLAVIYDFMALGTVRRLLDQDDFTWVRRIKVALWLARLLTVFHSQNPSFGPIVLQKIDLEHVLLDEDYVPKLCDFSWMTGGGIFPSSPESLINASQAMEEGPTPEGDVFHFGILLWSLISKKVITVEAALSVAQNGCLKRKLSDPDLVSLAVQSIPQSGCLKRKLSDPDLVSLRNCNRMKNTISLVHESFEKDPDFYLSDGDKITNLVIQCLHPSPAERISMDQATNCLETLAVYDNNRKLMVVKSKPPALWD